MPYNIHVVSMKPEYTADHQLLLHMVVATDSRDRAVELVQRMEKSSHFRQAQVVAENVLNTSAGGAGGGSIQFEIAVVYLPGPDEPNDAGTTDDTRTQPGVHTKAKGKPESAVLAQNLQPGRGQH